ncbi:MAG: flagellar biosynthesis protein FlgE [Gammaproteobacteria bacterium]|nr:flagellar biosynthesis protein FlgE [Gammaproteobacteria bacterium]
MNISPLAAQSSGVQTFLNANQRVEESANKIAQSSVSGSITDLASSLTDLKVAEQQAGAAVKIIEAESTQIGTLLDLQA